MDRSQLKDAIVSLATKRGPDKTICPSEVARHLGGADEATWRPLMDPIREQAVALAKDGVIVLKKGGEPVDPDGFTGIYRIAIADAPD